METKKYHKAHFAHKLAFFAGALFILLSLTTINALDSQIASGAGGLPITPTAYNGVESRIESEAITVVTISVPGSLIADVDINLSTNGECEFHNQAKSAYITSGTYSYLSGQTISETVSVRVIDDQDVEGTHTCTVSGTSSSPNPIYDNLTETVTGTITDNDAASHVVAVSQKATMPAEGSSTAKGSYTLTLADQPASAVTIKSTASSDCKLTKGSGTYTNFDTILNASTLSNTVQVVAVDDSDVEGTHSCTVTHSVSSSDSDYNGLSVTSLNFTITDNDSAPGGSDDPAEEQELVEEELPFVPTPELPKNTEGILDDTDADNDGVDDSTQPNVAVATNPTVNQKAALRIDPVIDAEESCSTIDKFEITEPKMNGQTVFPYGAYDFELTCTAPGASAVVTALLHNDVLRDNTWIVAKYEPPSTFTVIPDSYVTNHGVQSGEVTVLKYTVKDGGPLDRDGEENGKIVDPVGMAVEPEKDSSTAEENVEQKVDSEVSTSSTPLYMYVIGIIAIFAIGAGGYYYFAIMKPKTKKSQSLDSATKNPDADKKTKK